MSVPGDSADLVNHFTELYGKIRDDLLTVETENPDDFTFAAPLVAEMRNAFDYFMMGLEEKDEDILTLAIKSLNEAGIDVLEHILSEKIEKINGFIEDQNRILRRLTYPRKVKVRLHKTSSVVAQHFDNARRLKPSGYNRAAPELIRGIDIGRKLVDDYSSSRIDGMRRGDMRYSWVVTLVTTSIITFIMGIVTAYLVFQLIE